MIERTVGCLENGGRYLVHTHRKALRTRRFLHSSFWSHGAGDINLPSWWISLLQVPDIKRERWPPKGSRAAAYNIFTGMQEMGFLDFLYPMHTLAVIQGFVRKDKTKAYSKRPYGVGNISSRSRAYTASTNGSLALATLNGSSGEQVAEITSLDENINNSTASILYIEDPQDTHARLSELLRSDGTHLYHNEVWECYQKLRDSSKELTAREIFKLLRYLNASSTAINADRLIDVVNAIPRESRRAIHYSFAISISLSQNYLTTAIKFHQEALSRISGSVGTALLLRYAVEKEKWVEAVDTWDRYWNRKMPDFEGPDLWIGIDSLPFAKLMQKASSMADFAIDFSGDASSIFIIPLRDFALHLILRTFRARPKNIDVNKQQKLLEKAVQLKRHSYDIYEAALFQLLSFDSMVASFAAARCYRRLKTKCNIRPNIELLGAMLRKFCAVHSSAGLHMMRKDYQTYNEGLPRSALGMMMWEFAQLGDIDSIWSLFEEWVKKYGKPTTASAFNCILSCYARRGETNKAVENFHSLQEKYGFRPNNTSWYAMISAHSRVGDLEGAGTWFDKQIAAGEQPNITSYFALMSLYAKRGDLDSTLTLLHQAEAAGLAPHIPMIDCIVLAHIKNDLLDDAYNLIEQTTKSDIKGSRIRMWNYLLNSYAMRRDVEKILILYTRLRGLNVAPDAITYGALMQSLTRVHPDAAYKILRVVLPRAGIMARRIHYAIVMSGFLQSKEYAKVVAVYNRMVSQRVSPGFSTQNILIRAVANVDHRLNTKIKRQSEQNQSGNVGFSPDSTENQSKLAIKVLEKTLAAMDLKEFATEEPIKGMGANRIDEAFSSSHLSYLINFYGRHKSVDKISTLYDKYIETAKKFQQGSDISPPLEMISSLMAVNLNQNDHEEVERCWYLALEKAEKLARRADMKASQPGWVLYSRRFLMNPPLVFYLRSLVMQKKIDDLIGAVDYLVNAGYELNSQNCNSYVKALARNGHEILAFELCEKELMGSWPGWAFLGKPLKLFKKYEKIVPRRWQPHKRMPSYSTFVYLTRIYMDMRSEGGRLLQKVHNVAPKTLDAVTNMPKLDEELQRRILRDHDMS